MNQSLNDLFPSFNELVQRFADPPRDYSPVPIWWWSGEPLDPERLRWQLEQFAAGGVYNLVVLNLAPTGPLYGSDADDPAFLSEAWWQIFRGMCADARQLGVRIWFYDQLGFSGANLQAGLVRDTPTFAGQWLGSVMVEGEGRLMVMCPPAGEPLAAADHGYVGWAAGRRRWCRAAPLAADLCYPPRVRLFQRGRLCQAAGYCAW
jgi:hypothetical protein